MEWQTAEDAVRYHLEDDETLLWAGRPLQGVKLRPHDIFMIPFSLLWGGFAIFWEVMALWMSFANGDGGPPGFAAIIFPLFGLPFVLIGLYLIFGRFYVDAWRRARTFYAVTDDRILILSGLLSRSVKSLNLRTLSDLSMTQKRDGTGTINLGPTHPFAAAFGGAMWPGAAWFGLPCLELVPNVSEVYRIIRDAQKEE